MHDVETTPPNPCLILPLPLASPSLRNLVYIYRLGSLASSS